jgi:hypothetical protein
MLIRCLMYLINLTLLYILFVAITDIQKNISRKIHRINQSEYIKFVEDKTTILLLSVLLCCLPFQSFTKQKESYSLWFIHLLKAKNKVRCRFLFDWCTS